VLDARGITLEFGSRTVLDDIDVRVGAGSRIGLIGPNGSGKSTLLRVLAGLQTPTRGAVRVTGAVGFLPQMADAGETGATVRALVLDRIGVAGAERALDRAAAALADGDLAAVEPHAAALEHWLALGGDDAQARLGAAAKEVGLDPELLDRPLRTLSGGQAARAGLAALQTARHDVLLLDEPTNHLDADGLERLAAILRARTAGIVLVSHDRALLAETATELVELDGRTGRARHYAGGWDAYERERAHARRRAHDEHERAVQRRARLAAAAEETRRRAAAATRKTRGGMPDGDKNAREWVRARADGMAARARKVEARATREPLPEKPWADAVLKLALTAAERRGGAIVALERAVLERGGWRLGPLDLDLAYGDRVLLSGRNGAGKSTLLGALAGTVELADGNRRAAPAAVIAQLGQARDALTADRPLAAVVSALTGAGEAAARTALAAFGLAAQAVERPAASLSPGERTRAELAVLGAQRANCLLLDEPTNHLDVASLELLEHALAGWPGAVVVATHDRRLRRALRLDRELRL
jgi:ATPase subunit of ABC transporter with duplicated ATPase domains